MKDVFFHSESLTDDSKAKFQLLDIITIQVPEHEASGLTAIFTEEENRFRMGMPTK